MCSCFTSVYAWVGASLIFQRNTQGEGALAGYNETKIVGEFGVGGETDIIL